MRREIENLLPPCMRGFPTGYYVWLHPAVDLAVRMKTNATQGQRCMQANNKNEQERERQEKEEKEKEDRARHLPRSKRVLDYANAVLAVGQRRRRHEDGRPAADGHIQSGARGVDGAVE